MSKITTKARNALPKEKFALPQERKYPVDTKARAANAKARATQMVDKGKLSASQKSTIDSKANRVLGKSKDDKPKSSTITAHRTLRGTRKY
jgi:hypothetical protein